MGGSANVQSPAQASGKGASQAPQTQQTSYGQSNYGQPVGYYGQTGYGQSNYGQSNYGMPNFGYQQPSYYQPQQATGKGASQYQPQYESPQATGKGPQQFTNMSAPQLSQAVPAPMRATDYQPLEPQRPAQEPQYADGGEVVAPGMSLLMMEKK